MMKLIPGKTVVVFTRNCYYKVLFSDKPDFRYVLLEEGSLGVYEGKSHMKHPYRISIGEIQVDFSADEFEPIGEL